MASTKTSSSSSSRASFKASTHSLFDRIHSQLAKVLRQSITPATKDLAKCVNKLQQFQRAHLGRAPPLGAAGQDAAVFPRIPARLFKNYAADGPLYLMLRTAYDFKHDHEMKKWDFDNVAKKALHLGCIAAIVDALRKEGWLKDPVIAFSSKIEDEERAELQELAVALKAKVVPHLTSKVTHILQHAGEHEGGQSSQHSTEQEWYRTLDKRNDHVLLHYWYKPDSADVWVPDTGEYLEPEPAPQHEGPWHLSVRWLRDSYENNEWMNEEDYEAEHPEPADEPVAGADDLSGESVDGEAEDGNDDYASEDVDEDIKSFKSRSYLGSPEPAASTIGGDLVDIDEDDDLMSVTGSEWRTNLGPAPVPHVHVLDLDQKGVRAKKYEYRPHVGGVIHNISHTMCMPMLRGTAQSIEGNFSEAERWSFWVEEEVKEEEQPTQTANGDVEESDQDPAHLKAESLTNMDVDVTSTPSGDGANGISTVSRINTIANSTPHINGESLPEFDDSRYPNQATWFSLDSIHEVERTNLFELFSGKPWSRSTRESGLDSDSESPSKYVRDDTTYMYLRNSIIIAYRRNPSKYLSIMECARHLHTAPIEDVSTVHRFLEHWGLINLQTTESPPTGVRSVYASYLRGEDRNDTDGGVSADFVYTFFPIPGKATEVETEDEETRKASSDQRCETCHEPIKPSYHYVQKARPHITLCVDCFLTGRFPSDLPSDHFTLVDDDDDGCFDGGGFDNVGRPEAYVTARLEDDGRRRYRPSPRHPPSTPWTQEESLLLLNHLSTHSELVTETKWAAVAANLKRPVEECVVQFLKCGAASAEEQREEARRVFEHTPANPVMAFLAATTSVVSPGIAADCAHMVLREIGEEISAEKVVKTAESNGTDVLKVEKVEGNPAPASTSHAYTPSPKTVQRMHDTARRRAKDYAKYENDEISILVKALIDAQLKKVAIKMKLLKLLSGDVDLDDVDDNAPPVAADPTSTLSSLPLMDSDFAPDSAMTMDSGTPLSSLYDLSALPETPMLGSGDGGSPML
ncbi:SWIRM domain-containing protein [Fimicolochytrium jonesii]|uniref:SWIRM domain-containing protein n=1 Tax=Fimicolochytrium jonesii TaxID=1396493 RepID=UPI0022FE0078|nr:SWIRM domain-containing protein [Fimicolochytrium jonesii]KAI8818088.1 SWIRM domain-containing protein [Fimicolochytrium jonesii]